MRDFLYDLRFGLRSLAHEPAFTVVAVLTLAVGISANVAIFSVVHGVLLRPLPYQDVDGIVALWQTNVKGGVEQEKVSPANFLDWRDQNEVFEAMASAEPFGFDLSGDGEPERLKAWRVSEGFFRILGTRAAFGRLFLPEEEMETAGERVVVVSHGFWRRRFGSDPAVLGRSIRLSGDPYRVVGILPEKFRFPPDKDIWVPRAFGEEARQLRGRTNLHVIARLRPGVTVEQARRELDGIAAQIALQDPEAKDMGAAVLPLREQILGQVQPALLVLLGAVGLVLLIACANVANLLIARGIRRQREFAGRVALGATRSRLARQFLAEGGLLALAGGAVGLFLAYFLVHSVRTLNPGNLPRIEEIGIDFPVLLFALGIAALTAGIFSVAPMIRLSEPDLWGTLAGRGGTLAAGTDKGLRGVLVVLEIALAMVLLIGTGLLLQSFIRLLRVDPGFEADRVAVLEMHVWSRFQEPEQQAAFFEQVVQRIEAVPGVLAAGAVSSLPFLESRSDIEASFTIPGRPSPARSGELLTYQTVATPDYFHALSTPLRRGRFFNSFDTRVSRPVALINEEMARRYWPGEDPVGKTIAVGSFGESQQREIVGVVGNVRYSRLDDGPRPEVFVPSAQDPFGSMALVVKTGSAPEGLLPAVKKAVWSVEKDQTFSNVATLEDLVESSVSSRRFSVVLLGFFAVVAFVLAIAGVYGLVSFSTSQRRREIGLRMALGAQGRDIARMVLREGMLLVLLGIVLGAVGAFALSQLLRNLLFEVTPGDPVTFAALSVFLGGVALLASYVPARRAARIDPMDVLRCD